MLREYDYENGEMILAQSKSWDGNEWVDYDGLYQTFMNPQGLEYIYTNCYRLEVNSSYIVNVKNHLLTDEIELNSYPNPVSDDLFIDIYSGIKDKILIEIVDVYGNNIMGPEQVYLQVGKTHYQTNITDLSSGNFFLRIVSKNVNITNRITIIK